MEVGALSIFQNCRDRHDDADIMRGELAIARLTSGESVDVVVCDLMMPAPSGMELYQRVVERRPELDRVLAATQEKAAGLGLKTALLPSWRDGDTVEDLQALMDASAADAKKPKNEQAFSTRTAGALQHLAKRLRSQT